LNVWRDKQLVIYWGVVGFSLRASVAGKLQTVIDAYPEWAVSVVRKKDKERLGLIGPEYAKYSEALSIVPSAHEVLLAEKKYIKHETLTAENLRTIFQATDELVDTILTGD